MERFDNFKLIFVIIFSIFAIVSLVMAFVFVFNPVVSESQHVHFFDTNVCCDIKSSWVEKGIAYIHFYDDSEIKCSADNVIVYVDHPCAYCDWGH